ncbi:hypothetical protein [Roseateles sp. P5_E1]
MAQVNLPQTLGVAYWDKQKSALAKAAKAPATKLPDALKELTKQHLALDWDAYGTDKLKTADDAKARAAELDAAVKGKIKALLSQAQTVETAATSFESEAKKDKIFPKEPLTAAAAIVKAAKEYRADVDTAVTAARKALDAKTQELAAQKSASGPSSAVVAKQTKLLKSKLLTAIALLRKPQPNARPMRFVIVLGKTSASLALAYAVGPAQEKLLKGLMPGEAPFKVLKDMKAVVVWEKNALTFVSDRLASTTLKKVQLWLKKLLKLNLKMRVRKSTGEVEETEGEDIPEHLLKADPADAADDLGREEFVERMAALDADIKAGLRGPSAARIKELMAEIAKLTKADKYGDADAELDEIEALLAGGEDEEADEQEDEQDADASTEKASGGAQASFMKRFAGLQAGIKAGLAGADAARLKELVAGITQLSKAGKFADSEKVLDAIEVLLKKGSGGSSGSGKSAAQAMDEWKTRRAAAVNSLKSVATKVANAKHASSAKAIIELQAVIKNLTAEPATLQQVNELQRWLADDDVVADVCELAEDIRTPLLGALSQLRTAITA